MQGDLLPALLSFSSPSRLGCLRALRGDSITFSIFLVGAGRGGGSGGEGPHTESSPALGESRPG